VSTVCHDVAVDCGWRACVDRSAQASTKEPCRCSLQGDAVLGIALVNGKPVDFHLFDTSGSVGCDVTIVDLICPTYLGKSESALFRDAVKAESKKHVVNDATMVPLAVSTFGKVGPAVSDRHGSIYMIYIQYCV
jgi:hypothetical protein